MNFNIRMGIPEMQELWLDLQEKYRSGNIKKKEEQLYKKWGKALKLLSADPGYPSLQTHEIEPLSRRYGMKVWQSPRKMMGIDSEGMLISAVHEEDGHEELKRQNPMEWVRHCNNIRNRAAEIIKQELIYI